MTLKKAIAQYINLDKRMTNARCLFFFFLTECARFSPLRECTSKSVMQQFRLFVNTKDFPHFQTRDMVHTDDEMYHHSNQAFH